METALLAAISMGRDLLHKNVERTSVTNASPESERNPDKRDRPPPAQCRAFTCGGCAQGADSDTLGN
ncbi:hypothetical protein [Pseudomonas sp.]|uniref:hypothetical protein n=1 Tax=Pseudomonas sp. TaxID=306 RepID=UPI003D6ED0B0